MLNDWIEDMIKDISHTVETDLVDPSIKCNVIREYYKAHLIEAREKLIKNYDNICEEDFTKTEKIPDDEWMDQLLRLAFNKTFWIE